MKLSVFKVVLLAISTGALATACTLYKSSDRDTFNANAARDAQRASGLEAANYFSAHSCAKLRNGSELPPLDWNDAGESFRVSPAGLSVFQKFSSSPTLVLACDFMMTDWAHTQPMSDVLYNARSLVESWSLLESR